MVHPPDNDKITGFKNIDKADRNDPDRNVDDRIVYDQIQDGIDDIHDEIQDANVGDRKDEDAKHDDRRIESGIESVRNTESIRNTKTEDTKVDDDDHDDDHYDDMFKGITPKPAKNVDPNTTVNSQMQPQSKAPNREKSE